MKEKIMVFLMDDNDQWLLLRNNPHDPSHGGDFWYTVTGGFDPGEVNGKKVAIREIKEETNLEVTNIENLNWSFIYEQNNQIFIEYAYLAKVVSGNIILNEEHIDYKWLPYEEFITELRWYGDKNDLHEMFRLKRKNTQFSYGPFLINAKTLDLALIKDLKIALSDYQRVLDYLKYQPKTWININIYQTKSELDKSLLETHPTWFTDKVPEWVNGFVGAIGSSDIYMLDPYNKETEHDYDSNLSVPFHEFIHIIANHIPVAKGQKRPNILDEGITTFLNNQNDDYVQNIIINQFKNNILPSSELLTTTDTTKFYELNGYEYAYYFMAYLDYTYGHEKIIKYLQEPNLLKSEIKWEDFITYLKQKLYNKYRGDE